MGRSILALLNHFGITDAADVTWAHAANSKAKLEKALSDEKIMMIEADVVMDPIKQVPIMAHPPAKSSDITLEEFLVHALKHSEEKGIKLDFKQNEAISKSVPIMQKVFERRSNLPPIILNADILAGPNTNEDNTKPVNSTLFFTKLAPFKDAILSPGWTTKFINENPESYSEEDALKMMKLVGEFNIQQDLTFPLRASLVALNKKPVYQLLGQMQQKASITIWTSHSDNYDPKQLKYLLLEYPKIVFLDLPVADIDKIRHVR